MAGGFSEVSGKSYGITGENLELVSGDRRLGERPGLGSAGEARRQQEGSGFGWEGH